MVYLTPDYEKSSNPSLSTVITEFLTTILNLSSLKFEQARVRKEENGRLFTGVFILQLLERQYLIERYPISKSSHYYGCILPELPLGQYEVIFRMSPETMHFPVESIEHHEVFHNNGRDSQRSVFLQTAAAVRRPCCKSSSTNSLSTIA
jgi:hypothetical protein